MAERALATAFVNIVPGTKDFESKLKGQLTGQMPGIGATAGKGFTSGFSGALKKLAATAAAAFAVGSVARFGKETILLAEDVVVANARLEQIAKSMNIFGAGTGEVTKRLMAYAEANETVFAADAEVIKATQAKLLTFKQLALTADEAGGSFDRATQAAFDLAAAGFGSAETNAVQLGKALQDPIKGLAALGRSGVTFTEAEKARITTLVESNKVGEAQKLVLQAIESQVGGTAAATAKATDRLALGWESVKESIGLTLLPAFDSIATKLTSDVFPKVQTAVGRLPEIFKSVSSTVGPVLQNAFTQISAIFTSIGPSFSALLPQIMALGSAFSPLATILPIILPFIGQLAQKLMPALAQVIGAVLPVMQNLIGIISRLATQLISALLPIFLQLVDVIVKNVVPLFTKLAPIVMQLGTILGSVLSTAISNLVPIIQTLVKFISATLAAVMPLIKAIVELAAVVIGELLKALDPIIKAVLPVLNNLLGAIIPVVNNIVKVLVAILVPAVHILSGVLKVVIGVISTVITWFVKLVAGVINTGVNIQKFFMDLPAKILNFFKGAGTMLVETGKNIIEGLISGAGELLPKIGEFFLNMLPGWIVEPFKKALGIASPSKLFKTFGRNIIDGLRKGLTGDASSIAQTMDELVETIKEKFKDNKLTAQVAGAAKALVLEYKKALLIIEKEIERTSERLEKAQDNLAQKLEERLSFVQSIVAKFGATLTLQTREVNPEEVTAAQQALNSARAEYNKILINTPADPLAIEDRRLRLADAQNAVNIAQERYNELLEDADAKASAREKARIDVAQAQLAAQQANADYLEILKGSSASVAEIQEAQARIKKAEQDLAAAQSTGTVFGDAVKELQDRIAKTRELRGLTDQLLKLGLDKNILRQIVEAQAVDFAQSIIAGGQAAVTELNVLADEANKQAQKLGEQVGDILFDQGIRFAESVVKGLKDQKAQLDKLLEGTVKEFRSLLEEVINGSPRAIDRAWDLVDKKAKDTARDVARIISGSFDGKGDKDGAGSDKGGANRENAGGADDSAGTSGFSRANAKIQAAFKEIAARLGTDLRGAYNALLGTRSFTKDGMGTSGNFGDARVAELLAAGWVETGITQIAQAEARRIFEAVQQEFGVDLALASGGLVNKPATALIGEAGPEVVTPLRDFERMLGLTEGNGNTVIYNAAPNQSLDSEQALFQAMRRVKVVAGW